MTVEERARRIDAAIEATPSAINWRSESLQHLVDGQDTLAILAAFSAAEAVMERDDTILRDIEPRSLRRYLWSQVLALSSGELAVMDLKPALD